jgi:menaquinone-dependent protoporphyrinogen oxidase
MSTKDRVLVAYGTKHGATAEIADAIGRTLSAAGFEVDVQRARRVRSLDRYRAVVLGSAVYAARWRSDAARLLRHKELRTRDLWLFSSGPVGEARGDPEQLDRVTRPKRVQRAAADLGAHAHVVFGGMVADDAGFIRKKIARRIAPELRDRRDWGAIEAWAQSVAATLSGRPLETGS